MSIHIDLSAPELRPGAVLSLIEDHVANRGSKQILFKVSHEVYEHFKKEDTAPGISVSVEEGNEINKAMGLSLPPEEYKIHNSQACSKCGKQLTFYDIFQSGRKLHGDDYVRRFLVGGAYHIQVHQQEPVLKVECTACGQVNNLGDGCYSCKDYTYA